MNRIVMALSGFICIAALTATAAAQREGFIDQRDLPPGAMTIEVRLPADAELWIQGYKTKTTGAVRLFGTPALDKGKEYTYDLKATTKDKTVTKQVTLKPGYPLVVDLNPDFKDAKMPAPAAGSFTFFVPDIVEIKLGDKGETTIEISRSKLTEAVELTFADLPKGVTIDKATIPAGKDSVKVAINVAKDAEPQTAKIKVHGKSGTIKTEGRLTVEIKGAAPVAAGSFTFFVPDIVDIKAGEKGEATIEVSRTKLTEEIELKFADLPGGVTIDKATIPAGKDSVKVTVTVGKDVAPQTVKVKLHGHCGACKQEGRLTIEVK